MILVAITVVCTVVISAQVLCNPYNWRHSVGCPPMGEVEWCVIE